MTEFLLLVVSAQSTSFPLQMSGAGWPGGFPPLGYESLFLLLF